MAAIEGERCARKVVQQLIVDRPEKTFNHALIMGSFRRRILDRDTQLKARFSEALGVEFHSVIDDNCLRNAEARPIAANRRESLVHIILGLNNVPQDKHNGLK